jgi:hypothetical protein
MKVFKINDCDWVAAKNIIDAIKWYEDNTGFSWEEDILDIDPKECNLDELIEYNEDYYNNPSKVLITTFRELLDDMKNSFPNQKEPYIILSTEY